MSWIGDDMIARLPTGSVVLSVGEGYGELALRLAERHPELYFIGSDLAPERIEWASIMRERCGLENVWFCVADATRLPFVDEAFEAGYARGLLQFHDHVSAITELRRVLRARLIVDQLGNRPFFAMWFWLFQRYEHLRARLRGQAPNTRIWGEVEETLAKSVTYWPLPRYRRWFAWARQVRVRANCVFVWETGRHHPVLGWLGYAGALDVRF